MFDAIGIDGGGGPQALLSRGIGIESQPGVDISTTRAIPKERRG